MMLLFCSEGQSLKKSLLLVLWSNLKENVNYVLLNKEPPGKVLSSTLHQERFLCGQFSSFTIKKISLLLSPFLIFGSTEILTQSQAQQCSLTVNPVITEASQRSWQKS